MLLSLSINFISPAVRFAFICIIVFVLIPLYAANSIAGLSGILTTVIGLTTVIFWYGESPRHTYSIARSTNIPGPKPKWLFGNIDLFLRLGGYHKCYEYISKQYGRVAQIQMGHWTQIVVSDPAIIKEIMIDKFHTTFYNRKIPFMMREGKSLLTSKGEAWHRSRRALNPAFNSIKLSAFADTISRHCNALTNRLDRMITTTTASSSSGVDTKSPSPPPIDVVQLFGDLTMDVIGSTSFDAEFGLQECPLLGKKEEEEDEDIMKKDSSAATTTSTSSTTTSSSTSNSTSSRDDVLEAAKTFFMSTNGIMGSTGSVNMFVTVIAPILGPLLRLVYPLLMTPESTKLERSFEKLEQILSEILDGRSQFSINSNNNNNNNRGKKNDCSNDAAASETTSSGAVVVDANFIDLVRKARDPVSGIGLENDEVRDQLNLFVLAGYETTANCLSYTTFLLAQHPNVEEKLVNEIQRLAPNNDAETTKLNFKDLAKFEYMTAVIKESLRLYPPAAMVRREAQEDCILGGGGGEEQYQYKIHKGTWMIIPVYSIHRDEEYWDKPNEFNPDRFLVGTGDDDADSTTTKFKFNKYAHLPFGIGPRNCIGQRFAMEEIKLALIAVYRRYTFVLHEKTELPLKLRAGATLSPTDGIWMTVHHRRHQHQREGVGGESAAAGAGAYSR